MGLKLVRRKSKDRPYRTYEVTALLDLLEYVDPESCNGDLVLYRGQRQDWPLLPGIARREVEGKLLVAEKRMLDEFYKFGVGIDKDLPTDPWELLAVAQHYRLPTRLLDWTENPLAAAWFCVGARPAKHEDGKYGIIWAHKPWEDGLVTPAICRRKSPFDITQTSVFSPCHITSRIRAQDGVFTVHSDSRKQRFLPFEKEKEINLDKILIERKHFADMRFDLRVCGIHAGSLFPDLDGIASMVEFDMCYYGDEEED